MPLSRSSGLVFLLHCAVCPARAARLAKLIRRTHTARRLLLCYACSAPYGSTTRRLRSASPRGTVRVGRLDLRVVAYAHLFGKCRSRPCVQNCTPLGILGNARVLGNCSSSFSCIFVTMPRGQKQKTAPPFFSYGGTGHRLLGLSSCTKPCLLIR
ncbi:uncharacterized protein LOC120659432 [Panicum virgatum]|uniref:uncharacterized protein LOC120659432 n=1 Tax=Panicum virgatum TaxID=38727 RepID=UPI0019D545FB|nr:uncharacterized protein LOC120659432 [Panicum virgatum]